MRLRLASLVAALGLVFLAMNEAGKPETWERLGFRSTEAAVESSQGDQNTSAENTSFDSTIFENTIPAVDSALKKYWIEFFEDLTIDQKKSLVNKFWASSAQDVDVTPVSQLNQKYLREYLARNPNLDETQIETLRSSNELWLHFLDDGTSIELDQIRVIRTIYEDSIYEVVEDRSAMNRSIESAAWNWSWKKLADQKGEFKYVSYIQLTGQPESHRGKRIQISGSVRGLQKIDLRPGHDLGMDSYKVLWIKPSDSNRVPYCVYTRQLPQGFPSATNGFVELNEQVVVKGVFFKLRSYVAQNDQIEICPLIVADSIEWIPTVATESVQSWKPPGWFLTMFFIGMPIIAGLLAWGVYRSSTAESPVSRIGVSNDNHNTWDDLTNRSDIKSDSERIQELYSSE